MLEMMNTPAKQKDICPLATVSSGKPHCSTTAYAASNDCSEIYRDTPRTI